MSRLANALLAIAAVSAPLSAQAAGNDQAVVILDFVAPADLAEQGRALGTVVAAELLRRPGLRVVTSSDVGQALGLERQKELLGCSESSCMAEVAGALGARYVLSGELSHFGDKILVGMGMFDSTSARSVARDTRTVSSPGDIPEATRTLTSEMAVAGSFDSPVTAEEFPNFGLQVGLGEALPTFSGLKIESLNLRFAVEGEYFFTARLAAFLSTNIDLARQSGGENFQFVPVSLGAMYLFRPGSWFRPYVSLGLGLGILLGAISKTDSTPTSIELLGVTGLAFQPWKHGGFDVQASLDLSGVQVSASSGVLVGLNFDFGFFVLF